MEIGKSMFSVPIGSFIDMYHIWNGIRMDCTRGRGKIVPRVLKQHSAAHYECHPNPSPNCPASWEYQQRPDPSRASWEVSDTP